MRMTDKYKIEFDVPEGYFDSLADRVLDRIEVEDNLRKKHKMLTLKLIVSIAAVVFGVGIFIFASNFDDSKNSVIASSDYISAYKSDLVSQTSDLTILDYISKDVSKSDNSNHDYSDIASDYPCPITFYDEL